MSCGGKVNATSPHFMGRRFVEKLVVSQLVEKFPEFYGTRLLIVPFTRNKPH
jgi:hypothetical protein